MRSLLFVPANDEKRIARVHERGADAVILDLEDAVAFEAKQAARAALGHVAAQLAAKGVTVFVRVNADWRNDLDAALTSGVSGIVAPKISDAGAVRALIDAIAAHAPIRDIAIIAQIETAVGLFNAASIAASGVTGLALGSEDLSLELGVAPTRESLDLPCKMIALAAASEGLMALGAPISIGEFRDLEAYESAVGYARRIGMTGAMCIHPAQVVVANEGFRPSEAELVEARAILAAWAARPAQGVVAFNGRMIDAPVVARARRIIGKVEK